MCIDLKSFFASCECVMRGLDPFNDPLVVADKSRGKGAIVLAITPYLKSLGVDSRCRVRDLPKDIDIIFARPRMKFYLETSRNIVDVYLDYISAEDIFVYSIDEVFIDLTPYIKLYNTTAYKLAYAIKKKVYERTKIHSSVGIGENMVMAKFAMDIESKQKKDSIAHWDSSDIEKKLWKVDKLTKLWGIGKGMERRLHEIGISSVWQLAHTEKRFLERVFGKAGIRMYNLANCIDDTIISKDISYKLPKSIGNSQMLHQDTESYNTKLLLREMLEGIVFKLKTNNYVARTVHLFVRYSYSTDIKGFSKRITLEFPSDDLHGFVKIIDSVLDINLEVGMIRQVGISLGEIGYKEYTQLSLFDEYIENEKIDDAIVSIKDKYGKGSVFYGTALLKESTAKYRNTLCGGHNGGYDDDE